LTGWTNSVSLKYIDVCSVRANLKEEN
jgi:hypothetical protein